MRWAGATCCTPESQGTAEESTPLDTCPRWTSQSFQRECPLPAPTDPHSHPHAAHRGSTHDLTDALAKAAEIIQVLAPACWGGWGAGGWRWGRGWEETKPSSLKTVCSLSTVETERLSCTRLRKERGETAQRRKHYSGTSASQEGGPVPTRLHVLCGQAAARARGQRGPQSCCIHSSTTDFLRAILPL